MTVNVLRDRRQNLVSGFHTAAPENYQLRIVGVNEIHGACAPNTEAVVTDVNRTGIGAGREAKEIGKRDFRLTRKRTAGELGMTGTELRQRPARSFSLRTPDIAAFADTAMMVDGEVTAEAARLRMLAANQTAFHHALPAEAGSESHDHDVAEAGGAARLPFAQQGHAGIVFQTQGEIEIGERPRRKINRFKIEIFSVGGKNPLRAGIDQAAKAESNSGAGFGSDGIAAK